jgi:hypothetical protein
MARRPDNREARRRALQALNRAARRGHMESGSLSAFCPWPDCRAPVALGVESMALASAAMVQHKRDHHGGQDPPPE